MYWLLSEIKVSLLLKKYAQKYKITELSLKKDGMSTCYRSTSSVNAPNKEVWQLWFIIEPEVLYWVHLQEKSLARGFQATFKDMWYLADCKQYINTSQQILPFLLWTEHNIYLKQKEMASRFAPSFFHKPARKKKQSTRTKCNNYIDIALVSIR